MKRLVLDQEFWYDVPETETVYLNDNPVIAASIDSDNIDMMVTSVSSEWLSKDKEKDYAGKLIPNSGRLTNVATFGA